MKKNWIILHAAVAILSLFMLTSCYDKLAEAFSMKPLYLNASVEEPRAATRAATNIQSSWFDKDELIAVYINEAGNPSARVEDGNGTVHYPAIYKTSSPNEATRMNVLTFSPQLYFPIGNGDEKPNVDIRAYYPSTVTNTQTVFAVDKDQTGADGDEKYKKSDLMFAKIDNQGRTSGSINLNFSHKMVKFLFNVVPDGDVTINDCNLVGVQTAIGFNPETGEVTTLSENASNRRDVKLDNGGAVIIPPQTLTGEFIAVRGTARKDGEVTKTDELAKFSLKVEGGDLTTRMLESGKVYVVNLSVGYDNFGRTYEIGKWDDQAGVISVAALGSGGFGIDDENHCSFAENGYDYTGEEIKPLPKVVFGANKVLTKDVDYELQYFNNIHVGKATVLAIGKGAYEGYAVAGSYTINQIPSSVKYVDVVEPYGDKDELSLAYARNYTINPTADTKKDIHLDIVGNGTMSYTVSRVAGDNTTIVGNVATIDDTGIITIKGTGTVKVTATMADDKDYKSSSDSFTLTVTRKEYDPENSSIRAYFTDQGPTGGSPTFTYDTKEHKPVVKVEDKVGDEWIDITSSCTVTYPDGGINAKEDAKVNIQLNAPYEGNIVKTYTIAPATPNLRIYEGTAILANQTEDLYLAKPNTVVSNPTRTRMAATDFGRVHFTPKSSNNICTVDESETSISTSVTSGYDYRTTATFSGSNEGNLTFSATVEADPNGNYTSASIDFTVHVVQSEFNYGYTGNTQEFICKATGEYLLEVYGAQGGSSGISSVGGTGAKVSAKIKLNKGEKLYVNVGQAGRAIIPGSFSNNANPYKAYEDPNYNQRNGQTIVPPTPAGFGQDFSNGSANFSDYSWQKIISQCRSWNGGGGLVWGCVTYGGWSQSNYIHTGGGGTDISLEWDDTYNDEEGLDWKNAKHMLTRIIVAGGGGGCNYYASQTGAANGGAGGGSDTEIAITSSNYTDLKGKTTVNTGNDSGANDPGFGGELNRGGYAGETCKGTYGYPTHVSHGDVGEWTKWYDARGCVFGGADGVFGDGGYFYNPAEGAGAGGGGWYGGGSGCLCSSNGPGGGGSSYVWCDITALKDVYPTLTAFQSKTNGAEHKAWGYLYPYKISGDVQTPKQRNYRYLYDAKSLKSGNNEGNGKAIITCLSTSNTVDLGGRN